MADNTGKRAQELREKRINEQERIFQNCVRDLSYNSQRVEDSLSEVKDMIRNKQKKDEDGESIESYRDEVMKYLSKLQDTLMQLRSLDKDNVQIPYYQQKIENFHGELTKVNNDIERMRGFSLFGSSKRQTIQNSKVVVPPIPTIDVSCNDTEQIKNNLIKLASNIDAHIKLICSGNKAIKPYLSQFESLFIVLKDKEPDNPMIPDYENRLLEWKKKIKIALISKYAIIVIIIALLFIP